MKITISPTCPQLVVSWEQVKGGGHVSIFFYQDGRYEWGARLLSLSHKTAEFILIKEEENWDMRILLEAENNEEEAIFKSTYWNRREKETEHFLFLKSENIPNTFRYVKNYDAIE